MSYQGRGGSKDPNGITNVPFNLISPFYGAKRISGSAQKVFVEVFVSKVLRKILAKTDPFSILDLVLIHTFSLPFLGAVNPYRDEKYMDPIQKDTSLVQSAITGTSEIPAMYAGYWVNKILNNGFVAPWIKITDLLWLSAGKAISQSVMGLLGPVIAKAPQFIIEGQTEMVAMVKRQQDKSNAKMK
jgi:hypothetical protein